MAMARKSIEERLAQLEVRRKTLKARLVKEERTIDTRRKILLGAFLLHRLSLNDPDNNAFLTTFIQRELPSFLTREADQKLFAEWIGPKSATE